LGFFKKIPCNYYKIVLFCICNKEVVMNKTIAKGYNYKGYVYQPSEIEVEANNSNFVKIYHTVVSPEGKNMVFDWNPYVNPTEEQFKLWVDLGCPARVGLSPLDENDLKNMLANK
jgi:hypothetical protein